MAYNCVVTQSSNAPAEKFKLDISLFYENTSENPSEVVTVLKSFETGVNQMPDSIRAFEDSEEFFAVLQYIDDNKISEHKVQLTGLDVGSMSLNTANAQEGNIVLASQEIGSNRLNVEIEALSKSSHISIADQNGKTLSSLNIPFTPEFSQSGHWDIQEYKDAALISYEAYDSMVIFMLDMTSDQLSLKGDPRVYRIRGRVNKISGENFYTNELEFGSKSAAAKIGSFPIEYPMSIHSMNELDQACEAVKNKDVEPIFKLKTLEEQAQEQEASEALEKFAKKHGLNYKRSEENNPNPLSLNAIHFNNVASYEKGLAAITSQYFLGKNETYENGIVIELEGEGNLIENYHNAFNIKKKDWGHGPVRSCRFESNKTLLDLSVFDEDPVLNEFALYTKLNLPKKNKTAEKSTLISIDLDIRIDLNISEDLLSERQKARARWAYNRFLRVEDFLSKDKARAYLAITATILAMKALQESIDPKTGEPRGTWEGSGGELDALRHCFWTAYLVAYIGAENAEEFTTLYEGGSTGKSSQQDLFNNMVGAYLKQNFELKDIVMQCQFALDNGLLAHGDNSIEKAQKAFDKFKEKLEKAHDSKDNESEENEHGDAGEAISSGKDAHKDGEKDSKPDVDNKPANDGGNKDGTDGGNKGDDFKMPEIG